MVKQIDPSRISDEEILKHFRHDRDNEWIGMLFSRYSHLLLGLCLKYLKDGEQARDSVQQIFLKILSELHRHRVEYFKGWIYQVARNHCLMQLRRRGITRSVPVGDQLALTEELPDPRKAQREALLDHLETAMTQLPAEQKDCVTRFYLQKKSYQQIATETGYSLMQVKSYIQNGKRNLRIMVDKMSQNQI